jgi:hypothetical protein
MALAEPVVLRFDNSDDLVKKSCELVIVRYLGENSQSSYPEVCLRYFDEARSGNDVVLRQVAASYFLIAKSYESMRDGDLYLSYMRASAELGYTRAYFELGWAYQTGDLVAFHRQKAVDAFLAFLDMVCPENLVKCTHTNQADYSFVREQLLSAIQSIERLHQESNLSERLYRNYLALTTGLAGNAARSDEKVQSDTIRALEKLKSSNSPASSSQVEKALNELSNSTSYEYLAREPISLYAGIGLSFTRLGVAPSPESELERQFSDLLRDKNRDYITQGSITLGLVYRDFYSTSYTFGIPIPDRWNPDDSQSSDLTTISGNGASEEIIGFDYTYSIVNLFVLPKPFVHAGISRYSGQFDVEKDVVENTDGTVPNTQTLRVDEYMYYFAWFPFPDSGFSFVITLNIPIKQSSFVAWVGTIALAGIF